MNSVDQEAKVVREWLMDVMRRAGMKPTPFAKEAGLSPSTLSRALDEQNPTSLERRSIRKIVDKFRVRGPDIADVQATGFAEPELVEYELDVPNFAGLALDPNEYVKEVNTRAVELAGYIPRDRILFSMALTPRAGDVVHAQVYSLTTRSAESVLRYFDPPYLVMRTADLSLSQKPLPVDGERVKIIAVARRMMRSRD